MRRAPLVLAGTVAGTAAVLAFPVNNAVVALPAAASASGSASSSSSGSATASPGSRSSGAGSATSSTAAPRRRSATGAEEHDRYGDVAVTVTVRGTKISGVRIAAVNENDARSAQIDSYAIPQLEEQVIQADSARIDGVSGATFTSQAFAASVASALDKLGLPA